MDPTVAEAINVGWEAMKQTRGTTQVVWLGKHGWGGAWIVTAEQDDPENEKNYIVQAARAPVAWLSTPYAVSAN
jgi:hypothetical protein